MYTVRFLASQYAGMLYSPGSSRAVIPIGNHSTVALANTVVQSNDKTFNHHGMQDLCTKQGSRFVRRISFEINCNDN